MKCLYCKKEISQNRFKTKKAFFCSKSCCNYSWKKNNKEYIKEYNLKYKNKILAEEKYIPKKTKSYQDYLNDYKIKFKLI